LFLLTIFISLTGLRREVYSIPLSILVYWVCLDSHLCFCV
jgi:hypothetical protein